MAEFSCVLCDEKFTDKETLQEHFRSHGSKKTTTVPNPVTEASSEKIATFTAPSRCELCDVPCSNIRFYWQHYRSCHPGWRGVDCAHCGKHFLHNADYVRHRTVHEGLSEDVTYECCMCDSKFYNEEAVDTHKQGHDQVMTIQNRANDPPSFKRKKTPNVIKLQASFCKPCQCQFANTIALAQHLVVHGLFMCLVCGNEMTDDWSFRNHQKVHLPTPKRIKTNENGTQKKRKN